MQHTGTRAGEGSRPHAAARRGCRAVPVPGRTRAALCCGQRRARRARQYCVGRPCSPSKQRRLFLEHKAVLVALAVAEYCSHHAGTRRHNKGRPVTYLPARGLYAAAHGAVQQSAPLTRQHTALNSSRRPRHRAHTSSAITRRKRNRTNVAKLFHARFGGHVHQCQAAHVRGLLVAVCFCEPAKRKPGRVSWTKPPVSAQCTPAPAPRTRRARNKKAMPLVGV